MIHVNIFMNDEYKNLKNITEGIHFEPDMLRIAMEKAESQNQTLSSYILDLINCDINCQHSSTATDMSREVRNCDGVEDEGDPGDLTDSSGSESPCE